MKDILTRKIHREYNALLLEWAEVWMDWNISANASNVDKANDYLVREMTWKSQEEIDNMSQNEFDEIMQEIDKIKNSKKK